MLANARRNTHSLSSPSPSLLSSLTPNSKQWRKIVSALPILSHHHLPSLTSRSLRRNPLSLSLLTSPSLQISQNLAPNHPSNPIAISGRPISSLLRIIVTLPGGEDFFALRFSLRMTTGTRSRRRVLSRQYRSSPYPLPSCKFEALTDEVHSKKKCSKTAGKKDWEDATCSVCLEYPHNAVLLLCSSHDKGCRPYMCGTSYRYSNCLDQFEKAYTKVMSSPNSGQPWSASGDFSGVGSGPGAVWSTEKCEAMELACPLCRGQVKGWTVVEAAREHLNAKKRACMQDSCSFVGTYKELRKHVRREHPSARPREVDPILQQKWRSLEHERERDDVISTIRSSMPGAMVLGDYVIERNNHHNLDTEDEEGGDEDDGGYEMDFDDGNVLNVLLLLQATIGQGGNGRMNTRLRRLERGFHHSLNDGVRVGVPSRDAIHDRTVSEGDNDTESTASHHQIGLGRSVRRRRRRSQR